MIEVELLVNRPIGKEAKKKGDKVKVTPAKAAFLEARKEGKIIKNKTDSAEVKTASKPEITKADQA